MQGCAAKGLAAETGVVVLWGLSVLLGYHS